MWIVIGLIVAFAASTLVTKYWRDKAVQRQILDTPNARSAHTRPTPRSGGVSFVVVFLVGMVVLTLLGEIPFNVLAAFAGGGLIALVGFLDDVRSLSSRARLLAHILAAVWAVLWLGGIHTINLGFTTLEIGIVGDVLTVVGIIWLINLYNFMDGIDGIAASEAIFVAAVGGGLLLAAGQPGLANVGFLLAAAVLGFLLWNWSPAKIFMGDVGSGFLGYTLALLMLASVNADAEMTPFPWLILLGVFVVDATVTLVRRIGRGERWDEAHRSHAYQHAMRQVGSHAKVTLAIIGINLIWLLPWSVATYSNPALNLVGIVVALVVLIGAALYFQAGKD